MRVGGGEEIFIRLICVGFFVESASATTRVATDFERPTVGHLSNDPRATRGRRPQLAAARAKMSNFHFHDWRSTHKEWRDEVAVDAVKAFQRRTVRERKGFVHLTFFRRLTLASAARIWTKWPLGGGGDQPILFFLNFSQWLRSV